MPERALCIEDIRRLPDNDPVVAAMQASRQAILDQKAEEENARKKAIEDEFNAKVQRIEDMMHFTRPKPQLQLLAPSSSSLKLPIPTDISITETQQSGAQSSAKNIVTQEAPMLIAVDSSSPQALGTAAPARDHEKIAELEAPSWRARYWAMPVDDVQDEMRVLEEIVSFLVAETEAAADPSIFLLSEQILQEEKQEQNPFEGLEGLKPMLSPVFGAFEPKMPETLKIGLYNIGPRLLARLLPHLLSLTFTSLASLNYSVDVRPVKTT